MKFFLFPIIAVDRVLRGFLSLLSATGLKKPAGFLIRGILRALFFIFYLFYFRFTIRGHRNIPWRRGALIAANHQSYLDPLLVGIGVLRNVTFVSKKENFEIPIVGPLIDLGGAYPIDRSGGNDTLPFFSELLQKGHLLTIFPEGTIPSEEEIPRSAIETETGLLRGKTGVIRLALEAKVPIIPLGISGSGRALSPEAVPKGERFPFPSPVKITLCFGEPIDLSPYYDQLITRELLRSLTDQLMHKISSLVDHEQNFIPVKVPVSDETYEILRRYESKLLNI